MPGFEGAISIVLSAEGGYVNNPADRGGETKFGITRALAGPDADIKNLTREQAIEIYRVKVWEAEHCDALAWPLSLVHFDAIVNHGPGNARALLELSTWADVPVDLEAFAYLSLRRRFYKKIALEEPTQVVFLRGWLARMDSLLKACGL